MKNITILIALVFVATLPFQLCIASDGSNKTGEQNQQLQSDVQPTDAQITSNIQAKFASDELLTGKKIVVETIRGVVTLKGIVPGDTEQKRAVELASRVEGVKSVESDLTVQSTADPQYTGPVDAAVDTAKKAVDKVEDTVEEGADTIGEKAIDAKITAEIKVRFAADELVKASSIDVDTKGKHVTLNGTVSSQEEKARALRIARSVKDVLTVHSNLTVKQDHT